MQLLGQPVRHNAFGTGVITGLSGNIITIDFAQGEKRFQYPDAFSRFLTLKDAGKQNEIRAGYERRLRAERAERQKELVAEHAKCNFVVSRQSLKILYKPA